MALCIDLKKSGERLRFLMKSNGLSAVELAEILYVSESAVYGWMRGDHLPCADIMLEMAQLFHVHLEELYCWDVTEKPERETSRTWIIFEKEGRYYTGIIEDGAKVNYRVELADPLYEKEIRSFILSIGRRISFHFV